MWYPRGDPEKKKGGGVLGKNEGNLNKVGTLVNSTVSKLVQ